MRAVCLKDTASCRLPFDLRMLLRSLQNLFALLTAVGCLTVYAEETKPKNVLFLIVDDLRPNLGCYGNTLAISPNIDALASDATLFRHAYCQYPICGPSRASFLSGLRPDSTGIYGNDKNGEQALENISVLNKYLSEKGFDVAGFGKVYHNGRGSDVGWTRPYFDTQWLDYVRPENKAIGDLWFTKKLPEGQKVPSSWEAEDVSDEAYGDGMLAAEAVKTLKDLSGQTKPFMMVLGFRHPHLPWCAPKKYWDLYDRSQLPLATNRKFPVDAPEVATKKFGELWSYADITNYEALPEDAERRSLHGYYACMSYTDAQIGKVIQTLKDMKLYDDTVIVLVSDNGYHLGENGIWCKEVNWEANDRVVLLLRAPGHGKPGQVIPNPVELVDVYPTLCAASGVPIPAHCEGTSLLPLVDNPKADWSNVAFTQYQRGNVMGRSLRTDRYRFTLWKNSDGQIVGRELYDYKKDPQGNVNIVDQLSCRKTVTKLTDLLNEKWPKPANSPTPAK